MNNPPQSRFHGSLFYLQRLDIIARQLDNITVLRVGSKNPPLTWQQNYHGVHVLYKELRPTMLAEHSKCKANVDKMFKELRHYSKRIFNIYRKKEIQFSYLFDLLDEWESALRDYQHARGLLMPDIAKEEDDADV